MKFSSFLTTAVAVAAIAVLFQTAEANCGRCGFGVVSCNASCHVVIGTACEAGVCQTACDSGTIMLPPAEPEKPTPVVPPAPTKVKPEEPAPAEPQKAADTDAAANQTDNAEEVVDVTPEDAASEEVAETPEAPVVENVSDEEATQSVKEMVENGTKD